MRRPEVMASREVAMHPQATACRALIRIQGQSPTRPSERTPHQHLDLGPSASQNCVRINVLVSCHSTCGPLSCLLPGYTWLPHINTLAFFLDISPEFSTACGTSWMFKMSMDGHLPCPGLHHMKPPSPVACRPQKQPLPFIGK